MDLTACIRTASALAVVTAAAAAQNVIFQENFDAGLPATWTRIQRGDLFDNWHWVSPGPVNGTGCMYHEFFCHNGFSFRDNILMSPPLDLRGFTNATFRCDQFQGFPTSRFFNAIRVTTDNGANFTTIYQETGTASGFGTITAPMNAFAGLPNVRVAMHYQGVVANDWWVDNVRVTTTNPIHTIANLTAASTATFRVEGVTPGNLVVVAVSLAGAGPIPTPWGNVNLSQPIFPIGIVVAGPTGAVIVPLPVPGGAQGIFVHSQAAEFLQGGGVNLSNSIVRAVQ